MTRRQILVVFGGVMLGLFLAALDQTIVATALPKIVIDLHGGAHLSWVVTAYLLTSTVTVPLYGKLSDLIGRRPLFIFAISLFLVGSALSGLAQNMQQLILFRGLQGIGAGGILPLALIVIGDLFSPRERGRYQGFTGAMFGLSSIVGPLLGGFLTDNISWRWIFYVNIPIGAVALFVIVTTMHLPHVRKEHRIDYLGAVVLTAAVVCLLLVATWGGSTYAWGSSQIVGLVAAGLVLLGLFVMVERGATEPVLPLSLFRSGVFTVSNLASLVIGAAMFGTIIYIPLFVQGVIGGSATNSGVVLIPLMLAVVTAVIASGQVVTRTGRYKIFPIAGSAMSLVGFWLLTRLNVHSTSFDATVAMVVIGFGIGQMMQTYTLAVQNDARREDMGVATATTQFSRSIGGTFGVAVLGTILQQRLHVERALHPDDARLALANSLHTVFMAAVPLAAIALLLAFLLKEKPLRTEAFVQSNAAEIAADVSATPVGSEASEEIVESELERTRAGGASMDAPSRLS
jgi:EmrB/QacA subfamily drug resistance transporter